MKQGAARAWQGVWNGAAVRRELVQCIFGDEW